MHTLQKSFTYSGDIKKAPVKNVTLNIKIPLYQYAVGDVPSNELIIRKVVGADSTTYLTKELNANEYTVKLPENAFVGTDELSIKNFQQYLVYSIDSRKIDNFFTTIEVDYKVDTINKIGTSTFEAIYFFSLTAQANLMFKRLSGFELDKEKLVLINKDAYENLLSKLSTFLPSQDDFYLLEVILKLVDFNREFPFLLNPISDEVTNSIFQFLRNDNPAPLEIIIKNFPGLFDFPLIVPDIKTIEAAGKFTVITNDNSIISSKELAYYDLLLEYITDDVNPGYHVVHADLGGAGNSIQNNSVNFSFTDSNPLIVNNIKDQLSIKVAGFDGSILWSKQFAVDAPELKELKIEVPLMKPVKLTSSDKIAPPDVNKKLRGQVIVYNKDCALKDISVIVKAKKDGAETFQIVGAAKTDNSGNFFMPYPFGKYTDAQAIVSLTPNNPVSVPVLANSGTNQTIADDFLFLLVTNADCSPKNEAENCDCDSPKKASRLPDHDDLIKSDEYSQDLGGGCINLSTPNRTLSEYNYQAVVRTSDPFVANYTLTKITKSVSDIAYAKDVIAYLNNTSSQSPIDIAFKLTPGAGKIERKPIDLDNAVKWQDDPDDNNNLQLYQAVTIATGHILHYKSKFKADGYSLGDLLYSLALAPGQKKEIVVFDTTHTLLGSETQQSTQRESLAANIVNDRSVTDQLGGNLNEAMQGQSSSTNSGISAGGGLGYSYGGFGASLGVSGGNSTTDSNATQNSARDVSQFFDEKLKQTIMQNSESFRQLNSSVVTTVKENQKYSATTEVVANHNHCHALTILYFEVLRHFAVYQELSSVEECVFVPFLMTNFTQENIYKWRDVLAPHLLPMPSNTYLSNAAFGGGFQHPLLKAFDANERLKTHYATVDFPEGTYDDERISNLKGNITVRVKIDQPKTLYERIKTLPLITTQTDFGDFMSRLGDALFGKNSASRPDMNDYVKVDPNFSSVLPKDSVRPVKFDEKFFDAAFTPMDRALWGTYAKLLGYSKTDAENIADMLNTYFFGKLLGEWDDIFNNRLAPDLFKAILPTISFQPMKNGKTISSDFSTTERYTGGEKLLRINYDGQTNIKRNEFTEYISLKATGKPIQDLNDLILLNVETVQINYSTPHYHGILFNGFSGNDIIDGADLYIPENSDEKRNPKKEDIFLVTKLIEHLNSNLEYYNKILWYRLDPDRRYMLLDGFSIELFDSAGNKLINLRSLASVVKNQLITVAGNSLVFPVAAGYRVSNSFISEADPNGNQNIITTLFDHYKPITPVEPYRISVPSRGVFAETLQSYCNACEKIEENRLQDWNKFPNTDEPTPFAPITVPTPAVTDWKAVFKDFAPPMVNIQNAPALPAPGAGLAGLSDLLGKSGVFKDITGLDATQQAALKTYLSNQDNAKAFAEMAKELAMQDHNTQHSDKITDSLKDAKDSGAINQEEYNKLTKQHLQQQIDGGTTNDKELNTANNSDLSKAAANSVSQGREVKAIQNHPDGTETSVEQKASPPASGASASVASVTLQKPDPGTPGKWINVVADEGPGFAQFDKSFDASNNLLSDYPDQDSGRFRIVIVDADPSGSGSREVKWYSSFDAEGNNSIEKMSAINISLTNELSTPSLYVSKPLVMVHETVDLPSKISDGSGGTVAHGSNNYRARLSGMFAFIVVEVNGQKFVFPTLSPKQRKGIPVQIFLLKQGNTLSIPRSELADRIAEIQLVYEPHGIFLNAHEYDFNDAQKAKFKPVKFTVGATVTYACAEIDVEGVFNQSLISEKDIEQLGIQLPPNTGGPAIRVFFFGDFAVNNTVPRPTNFRIAIAMNRSFVNGKSLSGIDKNKLMFSLMCAGRAVTAIRHYVVAHEFGHLIMDKFDFLQNSKPPLPLPADQNFQHHFNPPAIPGYPLNQNLMRPEAGLALEIAAPKRIWNIADADKYNQFADLNSNVQKLQIGPK